MASPRLHRSGNNRLLATLPRAELRRLESDLKTVRVQLREKLYEIDSPIRFVYFPVTGVISVIADADQRPVEVSTIGNEGMIGLPAFLGSRTSSTRVFVQIPGDCLRMTTSALQQHLENDSGKLEPLLRRYTEALLIQISQTVVCNARHSVDQRLCRWLLMTHDRVGADEFPMTQDFLAQMLGVRRATVNVVAGILQRRGLISYYHGRMTIRDRRGLERACCPCYAIVRRKYDSLLSASNGARPRRAKRAPRRKK